MWLSKDYKPATNCSPEHWVALLPMIHVQNMRVLNTQTQINIRRELWQASREFERNKTVWWTWFSNKDVSVTSRWLGGESSPLQKKCTPSNKSRQQCCVQSVNPSVSSWVSNPPSQEVCVDGTLMDNLLRWILVTLQLILIQVNAKFR